MKYAKGWFFVALGMLCIYPPLGFLLLVVAIGLACQRGKEPLTSHGSARLATRKDAMRGGLLAAEGLILGRADLLGEQPRGKQPAELLRIERFTHLMTVAATGRGKGVGVIVPNLLSYAGSVVVTDPKAENYQLTAPWRLRVFGQKQFRLDPFRLCGPGEETLNPLDFISEHDIDFLDACRDLANQIVLRKGTEHEPHWNDTAELMITAIIAYVCACERQERNLVTVRQILISNQRLALATDAMQRMPTLSGLIAELGHMMSNFAGDELMSILSTVQRHTAFLSSPPVAHSLSRSSFDPRLLRQGRGASVFLCLPPDKLETLAPLMRLWIGSLLRVTTRGVPTEDRPVLFFLDEAAHLGRIKVLEQAVTLMRGYGIRLWFFFQSLKQVESCYGEQAGAILDNIDTQQFFGINSHETCEHLSKRIGDCTLTVESVGESTSHSRSLATAFQQQQPGNVTRGESVTRQQVGRKLLFPDEIRTLPEDVALIFHRNVPVVPATLVKYFEAPEFAAYQQNASLPAPAAVKRRKAKPPRRKRGFFERLVLAVGFYLVCMLGVAWLEVNHPGWERVITRFVFPEETRQAEAEEAEDREIARQAELLLGKQELGQLDEGEQRRLRATVMERIREKRRLHAAGLKAAHDRQQREEFARQERQVEEELLRLFPNTGLKTIGPPERVPRRRKTVGPGVR